jgi:hypothetical protein
MIGYISNYNPMFSLLLQIALITSWHSESSVRIRSLPRLGLWLIDWRSCLHHWFIRSSMCHKLTIEKGGGCSSYCHSCAPFWIIHVERAGTHHAASCSSQRYIIYFTGVDQVVALLESLTTREDLKGLRQHFPRAMVWRHLGAQGGGNVSTRPCYSFGNGVWRRCRQGKLGWKRHIWDRRMGRETRAKTKSVRFYGPVWQNAWAVCKQAEHGIIA